MSAPNPECSGCQALQQRVAELEARVALLKARVCGDAFRGRLFAGGGAAAKPSGEQVPPKTAVYCGAGTDYAASSGIIKS
jgi:hypothetical protein